MIDNGKASPSSYTEFTREDCPACKHRGWCAKADDGSVICRRQPEGAAFEGSDKNGAPYYVHTFENVESDEDSDPRTPTGKPTGPRPPPASVEVRKRVYGAFLGALTLGSHHRDDLKARGLDDKGIDENGYRSLPAGTARKPALKALEGFDLGDLLATPGFYLDGGNSLAFAAMPGLLIPVRDVLGGIVALRIRPDRKLDGGGKYLWCSSAKRGGPSPGSPPHVPLGILGPVDLVRLTEGELKSDIATRLGGIPTVSAPGVGNWLATLPTIKALHCRRVRVAFDQDTTVNAMVALATVTCCRRLAALGYEVDFERWAWKDGKGIDDVLVAGKSTEILAGIELAAYLDELAKAHDLPEKPPASQSAAWPPLRTEEQPPALRFPLDVFPPSLRSYCVEAAEAMLAPVEFVATSMLATAGATVGQSVNIRVKQGWTEPPVLYVVLVARPGKVKSPVIRRVNRPLTEIDRRLRKESQEAREQWVATKKLHDKDPEKNAPPGPEPRQLRAIVKDITRESLVIILKDNPRGVLCDPDEASAWVASFNEYKKAGADRQFWLSVWSSASVSVDRKGGRESHYVPYPFISVLGGLPPSMLGSFSEERGRDDGFLDRILFSYPDDDAFPRQEWSETELSEFAERSWGEAVTRLQGASMVLEPDLDIERPFYVRFTPEAKREWVRWFNNHSREMEGPDFPAERDGAWSKMRAHAARFALILSRLRWACDPTATDQPGPVEAEDVRGSVAIAAYFKSHLIRVRHEMTGGIGSADARVILGWIRRKQLTFFREADVGVDMRRFRENSRSLVDALNVLESARAIRPSTQESLGKGRRPSQGFNVHPELLTAPGNTENPENDHSEAPDEAPESRNGHFSGFSVFPGAGDEIDSGAREAFEL